MTYLGHADAAISILNGHEGTLDEAVALLDHIEFGTKADMKEAIAYIACQVSAYRRIANEDAALAIGQIKSIVDNYSARSAVNQLGDQDASTRLSLLLDEVTGSQLSKSTYDVETMIRYVEEHYARKRDEAVRDALEARGLI